MQKDGTDCVGHMLNGGCYSRDEEGKLTSHQGYPCQCLRVSDRCTVYYVDYELGAPLPPNALIAGQSAGGLPVYFVNRDGRRSPKSYIPSINSFVFFYDITTWKVRVLVSLWMKLLAGTRVFIRVICDTSMAMDHCCGIMDTVYLGMHNLQPFLTICMDH